MNVRFAEPCRDQHLELVGYEKQIAAMTLIWVAADHKGRLQNMADRARFAQAPVPASLPPQLDGHQLRCLLEASAAPALASQLREFDPGFGQALNHAQQIAFAHECIVQARLDAVDMDAELPSFTLQRWQARQREATA
ncbi:hypothetical protein ACVNIS_17660 [Sphaerotilaceae bacterium SBD11-9]